jgi:Icc-related predicted phosphoesterase
MRCVFASDLHGRVERYDKLWRAIGTDPPAAVFLGGDLLPSGIASATGGAVHEDFVGDFLAAGFARLRARLGAGYPAVFLILGNDDVRLEEAAILDAAARGLWSYVHGRVAALGGHPVLGYGCVPPSPFLQKDWERYDVSRHVPPGCVSPEEGWRSVALPEGEVKFGTIARDLDALAGSASMEAAVLLFHAPPYDTALDRVAADGKSVDHVPLDLHAGSIALRRFIERRQPLVTLHGHIHESVRLTGAWRDRIGRTHLFGAAHDGDELALVRFDLDDLERASRELL